MTASRAPAEIIQPGERSGHEQRTHHLTAPGQAVLLDALDGVALSASKRAWLAGFEASTVENIAAVITRARQTDR